MAELPGVVDVLPKLLVHRLLGPAWLGSEEYELRCREDRPERLFAELALHNLDLVLAEEPLPAGSGVRAFSHRLGECGISFFARRQLARRLAPGFPGSLDGAPMLLPAEGSAFRRGLDLWFDAHGIRPRAIAEFDDSALLKVFGSDGRGVFAAHTITAAEVTAQYHVEIVGHASDARLRVYAISGERRLKHPAVLAISEAARGGLFVCGERG
jgi:LysR family transcriptional activator of nhaA